MESVYTVILAFAVVFLAVLGMSVKLFFRKKGGFPGASCQTTPELSEKGISSCAGCSENASCGKTND